MVFFNYALRKLNAKIVYYGPGLCGKTTNLTWIHDNFEGGDRGKMISLATEGDRTIFFDLLPLEIGAIRGMDVTLQLYTVPGQVHYNSTRQLVLRGADGVVFVADSQRAMQGSNIDSFKNLQENLLLQGISLDGFPHILQFNKRDLRDCVSIEELNDDLNHYSVPIFEATATEGVGVQETLEGIVKLVMRNLRQRYEGATTGARTPGLEDSQVSIPDRLSTPPASPIEVPPPEPISVSETPPAVEPITPPEPVFDPEPEPVEPVVPPDPPPVEPVVPPEPPPAEPVVPPDPLPVEQVLPPDPPPPEEPSSIEPPPAVALGDADPAETVDFSKVMGTDPYGGLGGGFEDEVSTAVYDVNDDSAIDFEELKKLDAEKAPPVPPPTPDEVPLAEPPSAELPDVDIVTPEGEFVPPEAPAEPPAAFDLESTDAGLKTQHATVLESHDSAAAFDFGATPPDPESIPDFELDEQQPEPEPEPEAQEIEVVDEVVSEEALFEPPPIPEPPIDPEPPPFEEAVPPIVEETVPEAAPQRAPAEGMYIDRIEAPSPFAPNPDAPGGSPEALEALEALSKPAEPAPVILPDTSEIHPAFEAVGAGAEEIDAVVEDFEPIEPPPGAFSDDESEEPPVFDVIEEFEAPPVADDEATVDARPIVDIDGEFEPPVHEIEDEIAAMPAAEVEDEIESLSVADGGGEPVVVADFEDAPETPPMTEIDEEFPAPAVVDSVADFEVSAAAEGEDEFEAPPIVDVDAEPEAPPVADFEDEVEASPVADDVEELAAQPVPDTEDEFKALPVVEVEKELEALHAAAGVEKSEVESADTFDGEPEFDADEIDEGLFEVTPVVPVVVGSEDPWTEEELSGVYRLDEVEKAEEAAAIEAAEPARQVEVQAEDNQLHLRLQGTGAIVESGQVRALDIEVPVPGAWVGNRRVTLQLRLTLTPDTENDDDGPNNPS